MARLPEFPAGYMTSEEEPIVEERPPPAPRPRPLNWALCFAS